MSEPLLPFSSISRYIDGALCGVRVPAISPCPLCGLHSTEGMGHPKSVGFRRAAHNGHVGTCYQRALRHYGFEEARYDAELGCYPLRPCKPVPFKIYKRKRHE